MLRKVLGVMLALLTVASFSFAAGEEEGAGAAMADLTFPLENPVTITYFVDRPRQEERHELHQELERRTNVNLEIVPSDPAKYTVLIASGDFPDMIYMPASNFKLELNQFGEQGTLVDFMKYLEGGKMPNYSALMERLPGLREFSVTDQNQLFVLGSVTTWNGSIGPNYAYAYSYAEEWAENGIPIPSTFDELFEGGKKLKEIYPDKYAFGGVWGNPQSWVFNAYHVPWSPRRNSGISFDLDTNEFKFMPVTDNFRDALAWLNKAYEAGLVDPEFVTNDFTAYTKQVESGNVLMDVFYFDWTGTMWPEGPVGPPPTTDTGLKARVTVFSTYGTWGHIVNSKSEHIEEIIALLDWGLSPEAELLFNWGVEGVTFEQGADGKPRFLDQVKTFDNPDGTFEPLDPGYGLYAGWNIAFLRDNGHMTEMWAGKKMMERSAQVRAFGADREALQLQAPNLSIPTETAELMSLTMAPTNTYVEESIIDFIVGDLDIDSDWDDYVATINENKKIGDTVATLNQLYQEQYTDKGRTWGVHYYFAD